jgi:hypothetical protein
MIPIISPILLVVGGGLCLTQHAFDARTKEEKPTQLMHSVHGRTSIRGFEVTLWHGSSPLLGTGS